MQPIIDTIPIQELASGDRLSIQVYKFLGKPGKKAYLQANLHGSEIVGNSVIYQLIEFLLTLDTTQLIGDIWLVPVCNPNGTNQRNHYFSTGRFNSYDGKDWNRIFWDYEKDCEDLESFAKSQLNLDIQEIRINYLKRILAKQKEQLPKIQSSSSLPFSDRYRYHLQSLCLDADYVLDIHSSSSQAIDYLYCFHSRESSAKALLFDYAILMNQDEYDGDAFDEAFMKPWLALEKELARLGKPIYFDIDSWTLELGSGMQMNPESVRRGVRGIKNYFAYKGMLSIPDFPLPDTATREVTFFPRNRVRKYYAIAGGMIQSRVPLGTTVKAGETLYQILRFNKEGTLPTVVNIDAEVAGLVFDISTSYNVNQSEYVLSMMEFEDCNF